MQVRNRGLAAVPVVLALAAGCTTQPPAASTGPRVRLDQKGPASIELVPAEGQPPYCLVFTLAKGGPIRQLTMVDDKLAPDCPAGVPIMGTTFRIPPREGKVKIFVIFSDRAMEADPIAIQISDLVAQKQAVTAMDLRAPGRVVVEMLEFEPVRER